MKIDFLTPDSEQIKHQIRNLIDSYSHEWDLLAELLQNSIDAIRELGEEKGRLELTIDSATQEIRLSDNGIGVDPTDVAKLLRPFGTNKYGKVKTIGEKGVGLKFVIFSTVKFQMDSDNGETSFVATIDDAHPWLTSTGDGNLQLSLSESLHGKKRGTTIRLTLSDPDHPILEHSFQDLIFLLRTKTAVGDTGYIWGEPFPCDIEFNHYDKSGHKSSKTFDCRFLLPTEPLNDKDMQNLDAFKEWREEKDRSDLEKRKKLLNKIVWVKGKSPQAGREIRYWSCFVPRREFWNKLTALAKGVDVDDEDAVTFTAGLETSTKGMPTGIFLELKGRGEAGYLPSFYMLIDDPSLKFDIGRKAIHGRQQGVLKELAFKVFRDYIAQVRKYVGGDLDVQPANWDWDQVFAEIEMLPNFESADTRFKKRPNAQEATIAALFFEKLGQGKFADLTPLVSGYKNRYDLYATWKARKVVIEFKYDLASLLKDFSDEKKLFDEVNAVVLWEVTENDRLVASRRGMAIDPIQTSSLVSTETFPNAAFSLSLGGVSPIYIVEMKPLIESPKR